MMSELAAGLLAAGLAGPPGQSPEDLRLAALKSNQRAAVAESAPQTEPSLIQALLPLILAQAADMASTVGLHEENPLPGMQSPAGRLGWGGLEAALGALLLKKAPSVGRAYVTGGNVLHNALVENNRQALADEKVNLLLKKVWYPDAPGSR